MEDSLTLISRRAGRKVLLISLRAQGAATFAVAERTAPEGPWSITPPVPVEARSLPEALAAFLKQTPAAAGVKHALVTATECRLLLLNQSIPADLKPEQVREMLRWEVASHMEGDETGLSSAAAAHIIWETGYAPAGRHQVAVAVVNPVWRDDTQKALSAQGIQLLGIAPFQALGWAAGGVLSTSGATAIVQTWDTHHSLSIFERGALDFHASYAVDSTGLLPRNLVADARSFEVRKLLVLDPAGARPADAAAIPGLPAPETSGPDWSWRALLNAGGLESLSGQPQAVPLIPCLAPRVEPWRKPVFWWAATAGLILLVAGPKLIDDFAEIGRLQRDCSNVQADIVAVQSRLSVFDKDAEEYGLLETELKQLKKDIEHAVRELERPGKSPCAQVTYANDSLQAIASAFASRVRVRRYKTDYLGRICIQGESQTDAAALDALEGFYKLLSKHPVKPAAVTTTKEGAPLGSLVFTADDIAAPLVGTWATVTSTAAATAAPAAPATQVAAAAPPPAPAPAPPPAAVAVAPPPAPASAPASAPAPAAMVGPQSPPYGYAGPMGMPMPMGGYPQPYYSGGNGYPGNPPPFSMQGQGGNNNRQERQENSGRNNNNGGGFSGFGNGGGFNNNNNNGGGGRRRGGDD